MRITTAPQAPAAKTTPQGSPKEQAAPPIHGGGDSVTLGGNEKPTTMQKLLTAARQEIKENGWVYGAAAGTFAGIGTAVGAVVGAPLVGTVKGLEIFGLMAGSDVMNTKAFDNTVFNWSKTMPASDATPRDINYSDSKTKALFQANLATNLVVCLSVPAAIGAVVFGLPGALAVGGLALVAAPFAEMM